MRYLIYGTGAVGSLLGGKLALAGQEVVFLAREQQASALQQSGLTLGPAPNLRIMTPQVSVSLDDAFKFGQPDVVLLTIKAYDLETAGADLARYLEVQAPVVSFLNGIGSEASLSQYIAPERVISATVTTAVQVIRTGHVRIEKERGIGFAGHHACLNPLIDEFRSAGFHVRRYTDPARMKWSKLLTNIVANASSAILGWTAGQVFSHPGIATIEIAALRETLRVMRELECNPIDLPGVRVSLLGRGLSLPATLIRPILNLIVSRGRGQKLPSLSYDIGRNHSEVYWLNGAVVQAAGAAIETPANRLLLETMDRLVHDAASAARFRDHPEVLLKLAAEHGVPGLR